MKVKIIKCSGFTIKPIMLNWERIPGYVATAGTAGTCGNTTTATNFPNNYTTTTAWTNFSTNG